MAKTTKKAPAKKTAAKAVKKTAAKSAPKKTTAAPAKKAIKKAPAKAVKKAAPKKTAPVKKAAAKKTAAPKKALAPQKAAAPKKAAAKVVKGPTEKLADAVVDGILEIKGKNITVMNLQSIHNRVCDYFIICQADSNTQVNAIAESIQEVVRKTTGDKPYRSEGFENSEWILIDYVTVVVHVFQSQIRDFYNLESLWADAEIKEIAFD
ncbi:MAG: ribosome silencing factor [Bacteroidetes bacterium]|nr:ribosome silencing factor [Bacteroidota bacterium]